MGLITKSDYMSATDLNHAITHLCHVVDVCSKMLKDFQDYCLVNMSDQKVVGIAFSCFWLRKKLQKLSFCATAWPVSSTFASESYSTVKKWFECTAMETAPL